MADTGAYDVQAMQPRVSETKPSVMSSEFWIYLASVAAVLVASGVVGYDNTTGRDIFGADRAWLFITLLTIGYLVSRGLAKAGSPRSAGRGGRGRSS